MFRLAFVITAPVFGRVYSSLGCKSFSRTIAPFAPWNSAGVSTTPLKTRMMVQNDHHLLFKAQKPYVNTNPAR
jgi:hypothetical protein